MSPKGNSLRTAIKLINLARQIKTKAEKRVVEEEMVGWHHHGLELGKTSGDVEGQEGLSCRSPWGHKELDMAW